MDLDNKTTEIAISDHAQKLGGLALQLGYQGSITVGALEDEIRFYQQRTVEACLELGKRLVLLKEITPHGEFNQRINMLNINERTAQRFMSTALKFSKSDNLSLLKAAGNQSKLLELLVLDDEEITELSNGGSVNDITLDDIDRMTASQLRKSLREAKANETIKDTIIQKKDHKINELDAKVTKLQSPAEIKKREESEPQLISKRALETVNTACLTMHNNTVRFVNEINAVYDTLGEHNIFDVQERITLSIVAAFQQIAETASELCVQVDFEEMVNPAWTTNQQDFDVASETEQ